MTALGKLKQLSLLFSEKGIEDPAREAELLLTEILGIDKAQFHTNPPEINEKASQEIDSLAARRIAGEPMQYLIGHVEFYGLRIHVGEGVLIPRPETELLVEETIKLIKEGYGMQEDKAQKYKSAEVQKTEGRSQESEVRSRQTTSRHETDIAILDLCTGSGCIALAIAKGIPQAAIIGIDASEKALYYARKNAECNGIENVTFVKGDLFNPLGADIRFDCIVSNPPYIKRGDIGKLQVEIRDFEPLEALDGGEDGLDFYRRILNEAPNYLKKNGMVIFEIGLDQAGDIRELAATDGITDIRFVKDYAGIDRIFIGKK